MSKYKALLVGAGLMGRPWGETLKDNADVELAGWLDIQPGVAAQAAKTLGISGEYIGSNLDEALHTVKPDFVVDVTPVSVHHSVVMKALQYGVPVLGEKPMADSLEHAREMCEMSEKTGQLYMVSQSRRYDPRVHAYRKLIEANLGALGILHADFYMDIHIGGYRAQMDNPLLLDMSVHNFDTARFLFRRDAVSVYCDAYTPPWSWLPGNTNATAIFEMEGGLRFTYRGCWVSPGLPTTWDSQWRAIGPEGSATWDGADGLAAEVVAGPPDGQDRPTEPRTIEIDKSMPAGITGSLQEFLHALETGDTPTGECHDNIKTLAMVFAAIESAKTKQRVDVKI